MSKRAERRHQLRRMKAKARRYFRTNNSPDNWWNDPRYQEFEDDATTAANHLAICSCWMCGNPRKFLKEKTSQEYKSSLNYKEQIHDIS